MRTKQLSFIPPVSLEHGGTLVKGKRKIARPLDPKRPIHIVMRSSRARGNWSLLHPRNKNHVSSIVYSTARRYGIRIYRFSNVGNHLHLLLQTKTRRCMQNFLRIIAGQIAFDITGAKKGNKIGRFWDHLVYTRIINWGRHFETLQAYLIKNLLEGIGAVDRSGRDRDLKIITLSLLNAGLAPPWVQNI